MKSTIALVGHCQPDAYMLRSAVSYIYRDATFVHINDDQSLTSALLNGNIALLVNRKLDGDFAYSDGIELLRDVLKAHPNTKGLLISNFADAQEKSTHAGATQGFGKKRNRHSKNERMP